MSTRTMAIVVGVLAAAVGLCAQPAWALLLVYEPFDYAGTDLNEQDGGTGFAGPWSGTASLSDDDTSLNYVGNPTPVAGDHMICVPNSQIERPLATTMDAADAETWYISLLTVHGSETWQSMRLMNGDGWWLGEWPHRAWFIGSSRTEPGQPRVLYSNGSQSQQGTHDLGYQIGDVAYWVSRITGDGDAENPDWIISWNVYENAEAIPTTEPGPGEWLVEDWMNGNATNSLIDVLNIQHGTPGDPNDVGLYDEIRIGTTYGDVVTGVSGRVTGDANEDGVVDDRDLSLLLAHWGQDVTQDPDGGWGKGEFNAVAPVQDADLSLLLANWTAAGAVPEPATATLLCIAAAAMMRRRKAEGGD